MHKFDQYLFKDLKYWYHDSETIKVVIQGQTGEILRIYDPMNLVNLSKNDFKALYAKKIMAHKDYNVEAQTLLWVVQLLLRRRFMHDQKRRKD